MRLYQGNNANWNANRNNAAMALQYISECFSFRESSAQEGHSLGELLRTLVVDEIYVSEQTKATDAELQPLNYSSISRPFSSISASA